MALPKKLKVGPLTYKVEEKKDLRTSDGDAAFGYHNYAIKTILIKKEIDEDVKDIVLLHEALHALMCSQEVELDYNKEEHVVKNLTNGLASFIKDNPLYIKKLMRK